MTEVFHFPRTNIQENVSTEIPHSPISHSHLVLVPKPFPYINVICVGGALIFSFFLRFQVEMNLKVQFEKYPENFAFQLFIVLQ